MSTTTVTAKPGPNLFAAIDGPPPTDMLLTWAEVAALGLEEAPADMGPSDYQEHFNKEGAR